jgi:hypothetical protein
VDFGQFIATVAEALLGKPARKTKTKWYYGNHGSLVVDIQKGTWYDFENNRGGGTLSCIETYKATDKRGALDCRHSRTISMVSSFAYLARLAELARSGQSGPAPVERQQTREERERARAQSREDIAFGRRSFLEQQARQAEESDPEAAYRRHRKTQALAIINAGRRARGLPLLTRLEQDREPSDEYPGRDNYNSPGDPDDGGDDAPSPKDKKGKKKTKKVQDEDDGEQADEDKPRDRGDEDNNTNPDERKHKAIALQIINAGRARRGLPLVSKLEQDR